MPRIGRPSGIPGIARLLRAAALVVAGACRTGVDYDEATAPRQVSHVTPVPAPATPPAAIRVVTFNVAFARAIDSAIAVLRDTPELRGADVILLQEMDGDGTRRIAEALGMSFVYYPAIHHRRTNRDFGNAVLARWALSGDARLVLPHPSRYAGTHRIATAATVDVCSLRIRAYATHLGTAADVGQRQRRAQLEAIVRDASPYELVIIGGDLNSGDVGDVATARGYRWPTRSGPRTTTFGRWDHLFVKGLLPLAAGTVRDNRRASDHVPVWTTTALPAPPGGDCRR
ncbi:MAG TPA: endonuclease/exonuclease/phosphatase family protein [Gemmatimonadaceae bacterium]